MSKQNKMVETRVWDDAYLMVQLEMSEWMRFEDVKSHCGIDSAMMTYSLLCHPVFSLSTICLGENEELRSVIDSCQVATLDTDQYYQ
jgi:hypothetical protein